MGCAPLRFLFRDAGTVCTRNGLSASSRYSCNRLRSLSDNSAGCAAGDLAALRSGALGGLRVGVLGVPLVCGLDCDARGLARFACEGAFLVRMVVRVARHAWACARGAKVKCARLAGGLDYFRRRRALVELNAAR